MNELLKVELNENQEQVVSGRMLHEFLEVTTRYNDWFTRMRNYGFEEDQDFKAVTQKRVTAQGNETTYIDHALKLDMAKEISMIQRTAKGKQARQYFIEVEKKYKAQQTPFAIPQTYAEALMLAAKQQEQLELQAPKVEYHDKVLDTSGYMTTTEVAKSLGLRKAADLNERLQEAGVIYRVGYKLGARKPESAYPWTFTAAYVYLKNEGYAKLSTLVFGTKTVHTIKWSEKGRKWLHELIGNVHE